MMNRHKASPAICLTLALFMGIILSCSIGLPHAEDDTSTATPPAPAGEAQVNEAEGPASKSTPTQPKSQPPSPIRTAEAEGPTAPSIKPVADKWSLWVNGPHLRGADLHPCRVFAPDECIQLTTRQDVQDLRDLGANLINASYPGVFAEGPPYQVDPVTLAYLDDLVGWAEEVGILVVIHFRTGPGRNEAAIHLADDALYQVWTDQAAHDAWIEMWRFTVERYRDNPVVVGYNLMVEPHINTLIDPDYKLEPEEVQAKAVGTLMDWNAFAAEMTAAIRQIDPDTPIIVDSLNWADSAWFPALQPTGDSRTAYSLHAYNPDEYTNQDEGDVSISYPDVVEDYGKQIVFDRTWLEENLRPALDFAQEYEVPIYVGEFGAFRWVPGGAEFLHDQTGLFEQFGWNYAYYVWRGDELYFDGFNMEYGPDPQNHVPISDNPLLSAFLNRWAQNVYFPVGSASLAVALPSPVAGQALGGLADVSRWLYLIDVDLELETVDQIAASAYDMVVLDFIPSEEDNTDYPMAEVVAQFQNASHPKLVIAYIDTGQAEAYRTYWKPGWGIGNPEWIVGADPDGWEGNFPVAYWYDEWREIWLGRDGYLQAIIDAGFDGVYLDWVEAYSDENVMAIADQDGVDPRQEMIWWVEDIADFTRSQRPDFIVIAQNAAELAEDDDYLEAIDAIAQEQVWFDGGADNDPPGDCPLPRTETEVDTEAYRQSLSPLCRKQYDEYPDSTLHVSSEEYLGYLTLARDKGEIILTVDYALQPKNVTWVYETSRALGFVPFVGNRALDQYVEPVP
jgi:cysteinyl-tRNA synthetase